MNIEDTSQRTDTTEKHHTEENMTTTEMTKTSQEDNHQYNTPSTNKISKKTQATGANPIPM